MDKQGHNPKVGILGGSFDPAHEGHLEITHAALEFLDLDYIWWLVSPGNPLKNDNEISSFENRFYSAKNMADDPRIIVTDLEQKLGTKYTIDTLEKIIYNHPNHKFIWLMGADNLAQFNQWKDWRKIADTVPFAIFNRPSYSKQSMQSVAATELREFRIDEKNAGLLYKLKPPAWIYYTLSKNPMSSTEIRNKSK